MKSYDVTLTAVEIEHIMFALDDSFRDTRLAPIKQYEDRHHRIIGKLGYALEHINRDHPIHKHRKP